MGVKRWSKKLSDGYVSLFVFGWASGELIWYNTNSDSNNWDIIMMDTFPYKLPCGREIIVLYTAKSNY